MVGQLPSESEAAADWHAVTARLTELEARLGLVSSSTLVHSDEKLAAVAAAIYRARRRRGSHFSSSLFSEPAWDMLLDLFVHKVRGVQVRATSLCLAACVPQATALRYIALLEGEGLAVRHEDPLDARVVIVELTTRGYGAVRRYLSEGIERVDMPPPR